MLYQKLINEIIVNYSYTIARIAKESGVSEKTIMRIRAGKIKEPRSKTSRRLMSLYFSLQYRDQ